MKKVLGMDANIAYGLSYLIPILALIVLLQSGADKTDKFVSWQSLFLAIIEIVLSFTVIIPLVVFVFAIIAAVKAFQNDFEYKLPLLGDLAEKIASK